MIIFICPTVYASGGPEAIHQLASKCIKMGLETGIYYYNPDNIELAPRLAAYKIPQITTIIDSEENVIIFPESTIPEMVQINHAIKVLWWLSVDNARMTEEDEIFLKQDKNIIHFSQSYYSTMYIIEKFGVDPNRLFYVSDYLNTVYLNKPEDWQMAEIDGDFSTINRERLILFNPKKGYEHTSALIMRSVGDIKWQALNGMTPAQMRATMQNAMVYVDFGNHPGMDRIPREAVLSGCCVITNKQGSAANRIDVPIADIYKREIACDNYQDIIRAIVNIMDNYVEVYQKDFTAYAQAVREQFKLFEVSIYQALSKIKTEDMNIFREEADLSIDVMQDAFENDNLDNAYRYMVRYRYEGKPEDERFCILENAIRNAVGEYDEAKYCALKALEKYPQSYELYLGLLHSIEMITERDGIVTEQNRYFYTECIEKAIMYSQGTTDEETVKDLLLDYTEH